LSAFFSSIGLMVTMTILLSSVSLDLSENGLPYPGPLP